MHSHVDRHLQRKVLIEVLVLNAVFFGVELVGGIVSGSLALIADAGHMLADAGALALALVAAWFASRPATPHKSFGFYRAEILAALLNGIGLIAIAAYVLVESVRRFAKPRDVDGGVLLVIAIAGLCVNLYSAWRLRHDGDDLNMRGARLHMGADAIGSVGAIAAGVLVVAFDVRSADAVIGAAIAALIGVSAWGLIREAGNILLEATPAHISLMDVRTALERHSGVVSVHDLHVWTLTSGYIALSAHVVAEDAPTAQSLLVPLRELVFHDFGIQHATLQVETPDLEDEPVHCVDDPRCLP